MDRKYGFKNVLGLVTKKMCHGERGLCKIVQKVGALSLPPPPLPWIQLTGALYDDIKGPEICHVNNQKVKWSFLDDII